MLVIVSDLHFTDGSAGGTVSPGAFKVFRQRLCDMAYDASKRLRPDPQDPSRQLEIYEPITELDVILLGDILDVIRSKEWGSPPNAQVRPWDEPRGKKLADKVETITEKILEKSESSLEILASLSKPRGITLPPANEQGEPDPNVGWTPDDERRVPVTARVHYMVGNHDWFFHLPDAPYTAIRRRIVDAMGLANDPTERFPHDPSESPAIAEVLERHNVFARHGDIHDSFNFEDERDASSLGDAIVIELLNRFPAEIDRRLTTELKDLPPEVAEGLKEIDNVRPLLLVPVWIDGLLSRLCTDPKPARQVKAVWNELVDDFFKIDFVKDRDSFFYPWDNVDKLQAALRLSQGLSLQTAGRLLAWINKQGLKKPDAYYEDALTEPAFKSRRARYIVYGHTHQHEVVPLDVAYSRGREVNQFYLNSGTWRRVYKLAMLNTKDEEFIGHNVMTYLAFFTGDERRGRAFESWSGTLGIPPYSHAPTARTPSKPRAEPRRAAAPRSRARARGRTARSSKVRRKMRE